MRRRWKSILALCTATATLSAGLPPAVGQAAPRAGTAGAPAAASADPSRKAVSITLVTGDRVVLHSGNDVSVQAGPGRKGMTFVRRNVQEHRYVVPADAWKLFQSDRVDRRLFDVADLAAFGYDDRARELPLLVSYPGSGSRQAAGARSASTVEGARVVRDLTAVGALAVRADRAARATLWTSLTSGSAANRGLHAGIDKIWLDGKRAVDLDVSVPQIGAPTAWRAGLDGKGVTVAVLDTGVDATHPDLAGQIAKAQNFTDEADADDGFGHGTHVASTIAGTGAASQGRYRGVAPGAKLLNGKVCDSGGSCPESAILAGMQWAAEQGAQVINMSLGGGDTPAVDPMEQAINDLTTAYGTLFVVAAGNAGSDASVGSPASADAALAVGAVDRDDQLAGFSSRGPRVGDDAIKPEITAPGVDIVAAKAAHDVIGGPAPVAGYSTLSGTSMATPHTAGAAAIVAQQHPDWTPQQRKTALMASAKPTEGLGAYGQGAGRVDVARVIGQTITVDGGSVSFGRQIWPHADDRPVTKTVTYRNVGAAPVTLALTVKATGQDGSPAPAGMFTTSASTVTVPAKGSATVDITADTSIDVKDGYYTGAIVGTADGVQVQAPFAVNREVESYDVTFRHTNRDGSTAGDAFVILTNLDSFDVRDLDASDGKATVRLPKGRWGLVSMVFTGGETESRDDDTSTALAQPELAVTADTTIDADAGKARPISVTVPQRGAVSVLADLGFNWTTESGGVTIGLGNDSFEGLFTAQLKPQAPVASFSASVTASFADPTDGTFLNSPYKYDLAWFSRGRAYDGFQRAVKARDLSTVRASYAVEATGADGWDYTFGSLPDTGSIAVLLPFDLPFRRVNYINNEPDVGWEFGFDQIRRGAPDEFPDLLSTASQDRTVFRSGRTYPLDWNHGVFAPSVANPPARWPDAWVSRLGDTVIAGMPLHTDGRGHPGYSAGVVARTALYRNGTLVGEVDDTYAEFTVPAGTAAYRLESSGERGQPFTLSTRVASAWTFRSGHVAGEQPSRLPMSSVRLTPRLDDRNTTRAGRRFDIAATVERQTGSSAGANRSLTAEVSYDDGRTWRKAAVSGKGDRRTVTVQHPRRAGFVSLRVKAVDTAGNTVEQTVIRAYRIG